MPMQGFFDATQYAPKQVGESHPVGKFPANITGTSIVPTKDNLAGNPDAKDDGMFIIEFTTPAGSISMRYNLWNKSTKAVEIARGQFSALCHATGVFRVNLEDDGAALRNARCMIDVGYQKGQEPSAENPAGGYTEIKKVYDANGHEPGKTPAAPQPQGQQWAPPNPAPAANGGWGNSNPPQQHQPQPQSQPNPPMTQNPQGGWSQQNPPAGGIAPPWKK